VFYDKYDHGKEIQSSVFRSIILVPDLMTGCIIRIFH